MPKINPTVAAGAVGGGAIGTAMSILAMIFAHEGGFVDDRNDPGGATRFGCTEAVARADGYRGPMSQLPFERCQSILLREYVQAPGFMPVVEREPQLAYEVIDTGVNAGVSRAALWFQASLNTFSRGGRDYPQVKEDGQVGAATIAAYDNLRRVRGPRKACELMIKSSDGFQIAHYQKLCKGSYALSSFCVGWIDNRIWNADIKKCGSGKL